MTYQQPPVYGPPQPPVPPRPSSPWWKRGWFIAVVAAVIGIGVGGASASSKKDKASAKATATITATATTTATATVTAAAAPARTKTLQPTVVRVVATKVKTQTVTYTPRPKPAINDGVYEVGSDIRTGEWRTKGGSDCYFAILNSTDTSDIADNGDSTGQQIVTLNSGKYFEISGGCDWRHV